MSTVSPSEMVLRILLAFVAGAVIGWERETHGRPAGLRTTVLACVASAVAMIVSQALFAESAVSTAGGIWRPDPARLGAGILTGIGFLGAGTILRHENVIRGVTTAATLWFVTVIGLAFGSGQFSLGLLAFGIALVTLFVLPPFEKHIPSEWFPTLTVTTTLDALSEADLRKRIEALGPMVRSIKLNYDLDKKQKTIEYELRLKKAEVFELSSKVVTNLTQCPGVVQVSWV